LGFQERRTHTGHVCSMMMIIVEQFQHGGSFLGLVWDPGITLFECSTTIREAITTFDFSKFNFWRLSSGCLEEWYLYELTKFRKLIISWIIGII
jgi:hypothetical protein